MIVDSQLKPMFPNCIPLLCFVAEIKQNNNTDHWIDQLL